MDRTRTNGTRRWRRLVLLLATIACLAPMTVVSQPDARAQGAVVSDYSFNVVPVYLGPEVVISGSASSDAGVPDLTVTIESVAALGAPLFEGSPYTALLPPLGLPTASWRVPLTLADGEYRVTLVGNVNGAEVFTATEDFEVVSSTISDLELIALDSDWSYFDDGIAPPPRAGVPWYGTVYNDASWSTGPAELGYGDGDEATVTATTQQGQKVLTQYFRHEFTVGDLSDYDELTLSVLRDDGAIVYLNGTEFGRSNMPTGVVGYATAAASVSEQTVSIGLAPTELQPGVNVLAVEVHQASATSSDISFAASLTATQTDAPRESDSTEGTYVLTAGDMARCDFDGDEAVAEQMAELFDTDAGVFLGLGDLAYNSGSIGEFTNCYDPTIGQFRDVTWPSPGNHEHYTPPNAAGYRQYFGAAAGPTAGPTGGLWYSFDIDEYWHVIALDSDCRGNEVLPGAIGTDGCAVGSEQEQWLRADLEANQDKNILAFFHHPPYTNNHYTDHTYTWPLWRALREYGAELTLHGHEHHYERYAQLDYWGDREVGGTREFIIGSGGTRLRYDVRPPKPESDFKGTFPAGTKDFGVLQLWLQPDGYEWKWESIYGLAATDSGTSGLTEPMERASISGVVTNDSTGGGFVGADICVTASRTAVETCTTSDANGAYVLSSLVSDTYTLVATDPSGDYLNDGPHTIVLAAPASQPYTLTMLLAPSLSGTVIADDGSGPLPNVLVCAERASGAGSPQCTNSLSDGTYAIDPIEPNRSYRVSFEATGYESECYDDQAGVCGAAGTQVAIGVDSIGGVDASLALSTGGVSGVVAADNTNLPIAGAQVCADATTVAQPVCTTTSATGTYTIENLPRGNYTVEFSDPTGAFVTECYRNRSCAQPLFVGVFPPGVRSNIDGTLAAVPATPTPTATPAPTSTPAPTPTPQATPQPTATAAPLPTATPIPGVAPAGSLQGVITLLADGSPIFAAEVCAVRAFPPSETCVYSRADGSYSVDDLGPGNYSVVARDILGRYLANCAGTNPCTQPSFFSLGVSQGRGGVNVALDPAFNGTNPTPTPAPNTQGSISGTVSQAGSPASDIEVCAVDVFGASVNCATSDAAGNYVITGLGTSNYRVEFDGAAMCYLQRVGCVTFVPVGVVAPGARTAIDADL